MLKYSIIILALAVASASSLPSRHKRSYGVPPPALAPVPAPVAYAPAVAHVPALAAVPTLTAVHSQRLIPQPPAVHTVASPTTVLQTVQTGNAIVGHQHVGDQVVGKTADVNGYAFKSEVRHDAPLYAPAPAVVVASPVLAAPAPVAVPYAAPVAIAAPPAQVSSYTVETGHTLAHDTVVTSPVIQNTLHAPVFGSVPVVAQVPVLGAPVRAPLPLAAYKKA